MHDNKFCLAVIMFICTHSKIIKMKALGPTANSKVAEHVDEKNWGTDESRPNLAYFQNCNACLKSKPQDLFWLGISYIHKHI